MNWQTEWKAISARIHGLAESVKIYQGLGGQDSYSVGPNQLAHNARTIYGAVQIFKERYGAFLPENALACLNEFSKKYKDHFSNPDIKNNIIADTLTVLLVSLQSELNYYLCDLSIVAKRLSERAFTHLQRCIVVDEDFRARWKAAFADREEICEKLGAVHLLLHGIWPFKISARGAITDLVFQDIISDSSEANRTAEAMVLTEWKIVRCPNEADKIAKSAQAQADLYASGALGGLELTQYRYLVLISEKGLRPISDTSNGQVLYRHINIAVDPDIPSVGARKAS